jgi:adenylylsulfate kinase-like enzyme
MNNKSSDTVWHHATVTRDRREQLNGHKNVIVWFTGLSGSGSRHWRTRLKRGCTRLVAEPLFLTAIMFAMVCVVI